MKHLLIILLILLFSSPLFGDNHKGETLYRWKTSWGYVWKGFGDKETHSVYIGDVENGKPNGLGIMTYPNGRKYVGEWKDGDMWNGIIHYKGRVRWKYVNRKQIKPKPKKLIPKPEKPSL